jgi:hypothetical protein
VAIFREVHYIGWIYRYITECFETMHRYEILNFENNAWFHIYAILKLRNISMYLSFVMHLPEDGHRSSRNV